MMVKVVIVVMVMVVGGDGNRAVLMQGHSGQFPRAPQLYGSVKLYK